MYKQFDKIKYSKYITEYIKNQALNFNHNFDNQITSDSLSSNHTPCHISCIITVYLSTDLLYYSKSKTVNGLAILSVPPWIARQGTVNYLKRGRQAVIRFCIFIDVVGFCGVKISLSFYLYFKIECYEYQGQLKVMVGIVGRKRRILFCKLFLVSIVYKNGLINKQPFISLGLFKPNCRARRPPMLCPITKIGIFGYFFLVWIKKFSQCYIICSLDSTYPCSVVSDFPKLGQSKPVNVNPDQLNYLAMGAVTPTQSANDEQYTTIPLGLLLASHKQTFKSLLRLFHRYCFGYSLNYFSKNFPDC